MALHHFFEAITNTTGDSLVGYFARVINTATQNTVPIYSDLSGTPIQVVSGVQNMAKTDDNGNMSLYVDPGTYHLDIYQPDATTFSYRVPNVAMASAVGPKGDQGDPGDPGPANSTYTTLAALKAAAVTNVSYIFAPPSGSDSGAAAGTFLYQTAGAPYTADGVNVIKLDAVPLTTGALVRQDASGVAFKGIGTGAAFRGQQDKSRDVISVKDYGALGDGTLHTVQEWIIPGAMGRYTSLAALQVDYPHVQAATDSMDWAAAQAAYNYGKTLVIPQESSGGYGALQKGGVTVYFPRGVYVTNDKPLEFAMNVSTEGDGPHSSLIKSTYDGQILRNDPIPLGPGGYNREGSNLRNFGIIGDKTKPNQVGLSLLRWISSTMENVAISSCGGDAMIMRECSCNQINNCRIALNEMRGLRMRVGLVGGWGTAENELPCNGNEFNECRWVENGGYGTSIETGVNGTVFNRCFWEYNDARGGENTGKQFVISGGSYVPNVITHGWAEGSNLLCHISVEHIDARLDINGLRHFAKGTEVSRALVATGGAIVIRGSRSPNNPYPTINGSNAPFRVDPAGVSITIDDHMGAGVSGANLVEKMDGTRTGLFGTLFQIDRSGCYGPLKVVGDSGSVEAIGLYRDDDKINPWAAFDPFRRSLTFTDTGIKRTAARELSLAAPDGGASFFNQGAAWDGNHLRLGTYDLWVDSTGKLRIKNGLPTSDTDGTVVGAQS